MSSPRTDPGATIAARGQQRPVLRPAPAPLDRLRAVLPAPLRAVPTPALFGWTGLAAIAALVFFSAAVRSAGAVERLEEDEDTVAEAPSSAPSAAAVVADTPSAKPAAPRAPAADLGAARAAGAEALGQLAQRFPEDPAVIKALFLVQAADRKTYSAALRTARRLLDLSPDTAGNADFRAALVAIANGPSDTASVALDVMVSEMGPRGPDLLFEVASGSVLLSKTKAAALLRDPEVKRNASPAVLVAAELLQTLPCARKALLPRARSDGDARALPSLKPLLNTVCGGGGGGGLRGLFGGGGNKKSGGECYRCFSPADREQIQAAVEAIEGRSPDAAPGGDPP
jgi:hypothetical protein